jgi:hypothetical protein
MAGRTCALAACTAAVAAAAAAAPTNFLVLMADDMGYGDLSYTGSPAATPNLAAMAAASSTVWFQRFYSGAAMCSPTRASVLTGRTPSRDCIYTVEENALPLPEATLGQYASSVGYATGFFGKWHLGSMTNATQPDCYPSDGVACTPGYVTPLWNGSLCCDGQDAHLPVVTPRDFGFDTVLATSQVAPTSTANCGCVRTVPGAGVGCNLGHYNGEAGMQGEWGAAAVTASVSPRRHGSHPRRDLPGVRSVFYGPGARPRAHLLPGALLLACVFMRGRDGGRVGVRVPGLAALACVGACVRGFMRGRDGGRVCGCARACMHEWVRPCVHTCVRGCVRGFMRWRDGGRVGMCAMEVG